MKEFYLNSLTPEEEDRIYGSKGVEIGRAFKNDIGHYFLQREDDVLHVNENLLINTLHVGVLRNYEQFEYFEISIDEFNNVIRKVIYEMNIDKYWNV